MLHTEGKWTSMGCLQSRGWRWWASDSSREQNLPNVRLMLFQSLRRQNPERRRCQLWCGHQLWCGDQNVVSAHGCRNCRVDFLAHLNSCTRQPAWCCQYVRPTGNIRVHPTLNGGRHRTVRAVWANDGNTIRFPILFQENVKTFDRFPLGTSISSGQWLGCYHEQLPQFRSLRRFVKTTLQRRTFL